MACTSVSVRLSEEQLELIDEAVEDQPLYKRSQFIAKCARQQAKRILKSKTPLYLPMELEEDESSMVTITVSMDEDDETLIEAACTRVNNKMSPFMVQATMATILAKQ